jgi:hypothetical protein
MLVYRLSTEVHIPSQESGRHVFVLGVSSQESGRSCICIRGIYQARKVGGHVVVY